MFIRIASLLIAVVAILRGVPAAEADDVKIIDSKADKRNATEASGSYQIIFCARKSKDDKVGVGHAFVVWAKTDERRQFSVARAFGFYPEASAAKKVAFGDVVGDVKNESTEQDLSKIALITHRLTVEVNRDVWESSQKQIKEWETTDYNLFHHNCTHFCHAVAMDAGIVVKSPNAEFPWSFISCLIEATKPK